MSASAITHIEDQKIAPKELWQLEDKLEDELEDEEHDPADWKTACEKAMLWGDTIYTGLFFQRESASLIEAEPVLAKEGPLAHRPLGLSQDQAQRLIQRMM